MADPLGNRANTGKNAVMRRSRASGGARSSPDTVSARGLMVGGLTVDDALAQLRRLPLRWPDGRVAHVWPAEHTIDSVLYAPFESRQAALVRVRTVHRLAPHEVVEIEVGIVCRDQSPTPRVHTDHLQLVAHISQQVADHLTAGAPQQPADRARRPAFAAR
ncbi:MAG: hypothetical protein OES57_11390 [Acidimicrobiia bacterium]|nr:hypothetical protein [Acidimicrobiia bacterium]